ncbi:MAG TPA: tetratricopeptide repeat protein [Myxococcales bacterium]
MFAYLLAALLAASDPSADLDRARSLAASGDLQAAADVLKNLTATFPTWGLAQVELSKVLLDAGGDDPALEKTLSAARSLEPLNPRAWLLTGRLFEKRADPARALEAFQRALDLRPDLAEGHLGVGLALHQSGRSSEAVDHLKLAAVARRDDRTVRTALAEAMEKSGDLKGAESVLRELVSEAPKNPIYRRQLVDFLDRSGQADKAASEAKKADAASGKTTRKLRPLPASGH